MSFHYPRHRIHEIVHAPKCLSEGHEFEIASHGAHGVAFDVPVDLKDGPFCDLRYLGRAGRKSEPGTYDATFLVEQQRVRGVGFCPIGRQNFRAKLRIPAGWHQNICDPNMPTEHPEYNRHEELPEFAPTDFKDFIRKTSDIWKIDLNWEDELL